MGRSGGFLGRLLRRFLRLLFCLLFGKCMLVIDNFYFEEWYHGIVNVESQIPFT